VTGNADKTRLNKAVDALRVRRVMAAYVRCDGNVMKGWPPRTTDIRSKRHRDGLYTKLPTKTAPAKLTRLIQSKTRAAATITVNLDGRKGSSHF